MLYLTAGLFEIVPTSPCNQVAGLPDVVSYILVVTLL
jgi:hypothetical protein